MIQFKEGEYTVNLCTDIWEWAQEFADIPEGASLDDLANREELESSCAGFACIEDKEIWIFVPTKAFDHRDMEDTVAHELGHIIEFKFLANPDNEDYDLNEQKAEYYEKFYRTVREISNKIQEKIFDIELERLTKSKNEI